MTELECSVKYLQKHVGNDSKTESRSGTAGAAPLLYTQKEEQMRERGYGRALGRLHRDRMEVFRAVRCVREGVTVDTAVRIAEDAPCRLSKRAVFGANKNGTGAPRDTAVFPDTRDVFTVFTLEPLLRKGDRVRIRRGGRMIEGIAGESYPYAGHWETVLSVHEV